MRRNREWTECKTMVPKIGETSARKSAEREERRSI